MDREQVLTWLEICGKNNDCSGCCPYSENGFGEYGQCRESLMADAYALLKEQPEIVRCKDCKNYDDVTSECADIGSPCYRNGFCEPDWFCADGKKKSD